MATDLRYRDLFFLFQPLLSISLRLLIAFVASVVSIAIAVSISNVTAFTLLMTTFGFLLSSDIFYHWKAMLCLLSSKQSNRVTKFVYSSFSRVFTKTFVSYSGLGGVRLMADVRSYLISFLLSFLRGSIVLAGGLVCIYFTSKVENMETRGILTKSFSGITVGLCTLVLVSDAFQRPYFLGIFRNCIFPKSASRIEKSKAHRRKLHYASFPRRIMIHFSEHSSRFACKV